MRTLAFNLHDFLTVSCGKTPTYLRGHRLRRHRERSGRSDADRAADVKFRAVQVENAFDDGKAEARASTLADLVRTLYGDRKSVV